MAEAKFEFELVSPERLVFSEPTEMVVIPGEEGDFGVLRGHAPFISTLRPGAIAIFEGGRVKRRIFVAGGFAEVTSERCTVLAEEAQALEDIDRAKLDERIKNLADDAREAADPQARAAASARLAIEEALRAALDRPTYS